MHASTQLDEGDLTTATSFEFLAPNVYENQQTPEPVTASTSGQEIPKRIDSRNDSIYIQEENPDDKENIPPIDDKENIPPPPLHTTHYADRPIVYKTPEQTIEQPNESVLPNDLQKGVELINALIDSRKTDSVTKKKLIRKIVRYLLKSKDTTDITQLIMSYSDKSNNSNAKISGVSSLTSIDDSDQCDIDKTTKDTISGVSALSSSSSCTASAGIGANQTPAKAEQTKCAKEIIEKSTAVNNEVNKEVKDWLLPITKSEIEKENARKSKIMQTVDDKQSKHMSNEIRPMSQGKQLPERSARSKEILEFMENEKKTHFNWIDQEIEHLNNLKLLLANINCTDSDVSKGDVSDEKINSVYAKHNKDYLTIYENFRRNAKNTSGDGSQADVSSTLIGLKIKINNDDIYCTANKLNICDLLFQIHLNRVKQVHAI